MFREFDLDGSGVIEAEELLALGKARRSLGQKQGEWTEEKNARLVKRMDANGDGEIQMSEFVHHFEDALPRAREEFDLVLEQFMEVAQACRARKQQLPCWETRRAGPGPGRKRGWKEWKYR